LINADITIEEAATLEEIKESAMFDQFVKGTEAKI